MRVSFPACVLFLHAFPLNKEMYADQMEALEREGLPYVALDYPGFGDEPPLPGDMSIERLTDFVVSKISALGVKKVVPVGDSMGGYIIFDMFRRYRHVLKALVFVATKAEAETPEGKKARYELIEQVREKGTKPLIELMMENQTSPSTKRDSEKMRRLRCIMEKATQDGVIKTLQALANRSDSTDTLKDIDLPTLVVAGEDDTKITPPSTVKRIADGVRGSRYVVLERCAHLPPFENPKDFNEVLLSFLREVL